MATLILIAHSLWAGFIVITVPCILFGARLDWAWVFNPTVRMLHLFAVGLVFAETVFRFPCPLTWLETRVRARRGGVGYSQNGCVMDWFTRITGHRLPASAFNVFYIVLFIGAGFLFVWIPPVWS